MPTIYEAGQADGRPGQSQSGLLIHLFVDYQTTGATTTHFDGEREGIRGVRGSATVYRSVEGGWLLLPRVPAQSDRLYWNTKQQDKVFLCGQEGK